MSINPWFKKILPVLLLLGSALYFSSSFIWLYGAFFLNYDQINLLLLLFLLVLFFHRYRSSKMAVKLNFHLKPVALIIMLVAILGYFLFYHFLSINLLMSLCFGLYFFGFLGLILEQKAWTQALLPFVLLAMTLPFGSLMDVYIGFPLRMVAVNTIENMFNAFGIDNIAKDSIISIENKAAQVDFSCSGLKGIWAGFLFYFCLSWLENLKINLIWLSNLALLLICLIAANIIRIALIVWITVVLDQAELAESIHSALGVLGFSFSCALIYLICRTKFYKQFSQKGFQFNIRLSNPFGNSKGFNYSLLTLLFLALFGTKISFHLNKEITEQKELKLNWPKSFELKPLAYTDLETEFLKEQGGKCQKLSFTNGELEGSILLIKSEGWLGHHKPEHCIKAGGNDIQGIKTIMLNPKTSLKWMQVNKTSSACYWFQSPNESTDDYSTRIWSEIFQRQNDWFLVSVVFNNQKEYQPNKINPVLEEIRYSITKHYKSQY